MFCAGTKDCQCSFVCVVDLGLVFFSMHNNELGLFLHFLKNVSFHDDWKGKYYSLYAFEGVIYRLNIQ
jgi:hypothetical protein